MNDNTALVFIIATFCALWAIQSVARAWSSQNRTCNCPCRQAKDTPVDLGK